MGVVERDGKQVLTQGFWFCRTSALFIDELRDGGDDGCSDTEAVLLRPIIKNVGELLHSHPALAQWVAENPIPEDAKLGGEDTFGEHEAGMIAWFSEFTNQCVDRCDWSVLWRGHLLTSGRLPDMAMRWLRSHEQQVQRLGWPAGAEITIYFFHRDAGDKFKNFTLSGLPPVKWGDVIGHCSPVTGTMEAGNTPELVRSWTGAAASASDREGLRTHMNESPPGSDAGIYEAVVSQFSADLQTIVEAVVATTRSGRFSDAGKFAEAFLASADRLIDGWCGNCALLLRQHAVAPELRATTNRALGKVIRAEAFSAADAVLASYNDEVASRVGQLNQVTSSVSNAVGGVADAALQGALAGRLMGGLGAGGGFMSTMQGVFAAGAQAQLEADRIKVALAGVEGVSALAWGSLTIFLALSRSLPPIGQITSAVPCLGPP